MDNVIMDLDAQHLFINSMLSKPELFSQVNHILRPSYFDPSLQKGVKFLQEFFEAQRGIPSHAVFSSTTKIPAEFVEIHKPDISFIAEQIASFCQVNAVIQAVKKSPELIEKSDFGSLVKMIKEASEIGLVNDFGIDYFDNPLARLEQADQDDVVIPTGWRSIDEKIGGGVGRQELVLFLAPSGGGKSLNMLNLGVNFLKQGLHGVYISLEMRDKKVATRADQMLARMTSGMVNLNRAQAADEIMKFSEKYQSKFFIKRMREGTTTANDIIAYLRQLETNMRFTPDFIIVDYLDIMASVQRVNNDNMFLKDKYVAEEVRAIGHDFNSIMISGSQLEKGATEKIQEGKTMHQGNVQGGSSKSNTSDLMIATVKTEAMHEAGEYRFEFIKARNSDATGKTVLMSFDPKTLLVSDYGAPKLELKKKSSLQMENAAPGSKSKSAADLLAKYAE